MLRNAAEQDRNYVCKSDGMGIGVTHVSVGKYAHHILPYSTMWLNVRIVSFSKYFANIYYRSFICFNVQLFNINIICLIFICPGTAPLDVTDFKCRGYDYTYMMCNFTIPHNVILTKYSLNYTAQSAVSGQLDVTFSPIHYVVVVCLI